GVSMGGEAVDNRGGWGRQATEGRGPGGEVVDERDRGGGGDPRLRHEPRGGTVDSLVEVRLDLAPQPRHTRRELVAPSRGFAQPEGDGGRLAVRILHADAPLLDAQDAVGHVAELKDVALQAF